MGNTLHGAQLSQQADCSEACSGDPTELCGGQMRTQVYQDSSWVDPNAVQLAAALQEYNDTLANFATPPAVPGRSRAMAVRDSDTHVAEVVGLVTVKTSSPHTHTHSKLFS